MSEFQIRKNEYASVRVVDTAMSERDLAAGEVLVKIDRFAVTANNITYAVLGDRLGYWQFFPPHGNDADGWGVLPMWGFADVVATRAEGVPVGERLFGYFPPSTHLKMKPEHVSAMRWVDGSAHRAALPAGYNVYRRVLAEPGYNKRMDDYRALFFPLFLTSYSLCDYLLENKWYGAKQVLIISASSKTSIGLAYAMAAEADAPKVIGMTSARNLALVKKLGMYPHTIAYDDVNAIDTSVPTLIVDMSGNGELMSRLHKHLGDNMKFCCNVGLTHWEEGKRGPDFIQERSAMFFAPTQIQKRIKEWGPEAFEKKTAAFLQSAITKSHAWLKLTRVDGLHGLAKIFGDVCEGRRAPDEGLIVKL